MHTNNDERKFSHRVIDTKHNHGILNEACDWTSPRGIQQTIMGLGFPTSFTIHFDTYNWETHWATVC